MSETWARSPRLLALGGFLALAGAGCALDLPKHAAEQEAEAVPRPEWQLGDRWLFQRTTLSGAVIIVTHQVVAVTQVGYTVRVLGLGGDVTREWTRDLHLVRETHGDGVTARYDPPASAFAWPIGFAKTWTQEFQYTDGRNDGRYTNTWKIGPTIEPVDTIAGRFYTLRIERWGGAQRLETYWYSPRVRYWVRREDHLQGYVEELLEVRSLGSSAIPR